MTDAERRILTALGSTSGHDADHMLAHLVKTVVAGVARPGSWERDVCERVFGHETVRVAAHLTR